MQSRFESLEQEAKEINVNKQSLKKNLLDLKELHHILRKTLVFFTEAEQGTMRTQGVMETGEEGKGAPGTQLCACLRDGEEVVGNNGCHLSGVGEP